MISERLDMLRVRVGALLIRVGARLAGLPADRVAEQEQPAQDDEELPEFTGSPLGLTTEARRMIEEGMTAPTRFRRAPSTTSGPLPGSISSRVAATRR
jgi:hypothetical protein